jgi:hypothetical protein
MKIRNRIKELRMVPARELRANPRNWRKHPKAQRDAMAGVLREIGYAGALLARETPDGLELIDGHLRQETTPDAVVPVLVLDVDEREANYLLATMDPLSAMAEAGKEALEELLSGVETGDAAVQEMLDEIAAYAAPEEEESPDAPDEVAENVDRIKEIKAAHKKANDGTAEKRDTEHYLVVVFPNRKAKEIALKRLQLPAEERYVNAASVDLRLKAGRSEAAVKFADGVKRKAASAKHSGSTG